MKGNIPKIREFPSDNRYWRVDAFGAIIRNHNSGNKKVQTNLLSSIASRTFTNKR